MAHTAVKDVVIWVKHIHGDDAVGRRLLDMRGGETLNLIVDGCQGLWRKMDDGRDGRPTNGIRPIGRMQAFWKEIYASRRGDLVHIDLASANRAAPEPAPDRPGFREAARQALLRGLGGYSSQGKRLSRDDLHDRQLDREKL